MSSIGSNGRKSWIFGVAIALIGNAGFADGGKVEKYEIDGANSQITFVVGHLGVGEFAGRFNRFSGSFIVDEDNPQGNRVQIEIVAASIDTNHGKRDRHLRGPDFFNAKQFPKITFVSDNAAIPKNDPFTVQGKLNFRGVTRPASVTVLPIGKGEDPFGGYRRGFKASFKVVRSEFGMTFMTENIDDEITLEARIQGVRR